MVYCSMVFPCDATVCRCRPILQLARNQAISPSRLTRFGGSEYSQKAPLNKPGASEPKETTTRPRAKQQQASSPRGDPQPRSVWPLAGHSSRPTLGWSAARPPSSLIPPSLRASRQPGPGRPTANFYTIQVSARAPNRVPRAQCSSRPGSKGRVPPGAGSPLTPPGGNVPQQEKCRKCNGGSRPLSPPSANQLHSSRPRGGPMAPSQIPGIGALRRAVSHRYDQDAFPC
ncbi:hypothetical protein NDU88_002004 [Pleurodeles waltl]|uniref:Uncharacterized protein n=1 Tax=Pleurodeles waltl TaxID=8319 RepID=A0AAV7NGR9_PLEWA|nr:hypothetical protein NDU88_002004 [Pleurodeles waltl]